MAHSESVQRGTRTAFPSPPDRGRRGPAPPAAHRRHEETQTATSTAMFRAAAPPLVFAVLVAGLLVELRVRLAPPLPPIPAALAGGATVAVRGNTVAQRALIWAEARWPGLWALPVLCAGALGALRGVIWAGAAVVDGLEERGVPAGAAAGVRVGRWEDGRSVSGGDLLAGMFT